MSLAYLALLLGSLIACQGDRRDLSQDFLTAQDIGASETLIGGLPARAQDPGRNSVVLLLGPKARNSVKGQADFSTCTGVLVAENIILTAAHCLKPVQNEAELFHDGKYEDLGLISFAAEPSVTRRLTAIIVHEEFKGQEWIQVRGGFLPRAPKDLALARFDGTRPAGSQIAVIPQLEISKITATPFHIYGYGLTGVDEDTRRKRDDLINQGRLSFTAGTPLLKIERRAEFDDAFEYGFLIDQRHQAGICFGDSGGPAFIRKDGKDLLIGIHSHRTGTYKDMVGERPSDLGAASDCQYYAVMTRTGGFRQWITQNIQRLQTVSCESQPLFRERITELFELSPQGLQILKSGDRYRIAGQHAHSDEKLQFEVKADAWCRIPTHQGYLSLVKEPQAIQSSRLQTVLATVEHEKIAGLEIHHLKDQIPADLTLQRETLIRSLTALFGWQIPTDGWLFQRVYDDGNGGLWARPLAPGGTQATQAQDGGTAILEALTIENQNFKSSLSEALSAGLKINWLAYGIEKVQGYNQELWLRDPVTHELVILRQSVRF